MSNREILLQKMYVLLAEINRVHEEDLHVSEQEFVINYKSWIRDLIEKMEKGEMDPSGGDQLGVRRALMEFDDLSSRQSLWNAARDAEDFYIEKCVIWDDK